MMNLGAFFLFRSSIGRKTVTAATGAVLCLFVIGHLLGNLQIFLGRDCLNAYAEKLRHLGPGLWAMRAFLAAVFAIHIGTALRLAVENRRARPVSYVSRATVQATPASRTMVPTGLLILAFVFYHLAHFTLFWLHPEYGRLFDARGRRDVYSMVILAFREPWVSGLYAAATAFLGVHLSHAFPGMFQSAGLTGPRLKTLTCVALILAALVFIGYVSIPAAVLAGVLKLSGSAA